MITIKLGHKSYEIDPNVRVATGNEHEWEQPPFITDSMVASALGSRQPQDADYSGPQPQHYWSLSGDKAPSLLRHDRTPSGRWAEGCISCGKVEVEGYQRISGHLFDGKIQIFGFLKA